VNGTKAANRPKAIARFKERIRNRHAEPVALASLQMVKEITTYLRGWLGYFDDCQRLPVAAPP